MNFLEKDLEEIIYTADADELQARGLMIWNGDKRFRQLRIGNYGVADLVIFHKGIEEFLYNDEVKSKFKPIITVYELKKDNINVSAFLQAIRYIKGIRHYLEERGVKNDYYVNVVLIGKNMDESSSFSYLQDVLPMSGEDEFLTCYTYSYNIDGLRFHTKFGYELRDNGFKSI